ncbi:MAG: hypothetical protein LBS55_11820, partial [Prevotellaceae bacterium]|nr:hypothetical protein [Prevotellaceae bacterium]
VEMNAHKLKPHRGVINGICGNNRIAPFQGLDEVRILIRRAESPIINSTGQRPVEWIRPANRHTIISTHFENIL